jgi:hypothetical protein
LNKWKKLSIGAVLLIGFALYTHYEKNKEPLWEVNKDQFHVIDSWSELIHLESLKYYDLKFAHHFKLLKNNGLSIPLPKDRRMLRIEKTWQNGLQLYVLYSVDLNERDKSELDVPRLNVGKVKFSTNDGKAVEAQAEQRNGEISSSGFVYKHRLYRSFLVLPSFPLRNEEEWETIMNSERLEFKENTITSNSISDKFQPIAFQIKKQTLDRIPETIAASPIDQTLYLYDGTTVNLVDLEVYAMGTRLRIDKEIDRDIVAFLGNSKNDGRNDLLEYHITGDEEAGNFLENYSLLEEIIRAGNKDPNEFSLTHSVHKTDRAFSFSVSKKDIEQIKNGKSPHLPQKKVFVSDDRFEGVYKGLSIDAESKKPVIHFTFENKVTNGNHFMYPRPSYHYNESAKDERFMTNLMTIASGNGEEVRNFDIMGNYNGESSSFTIFFYEDLPASDLTITLSNVAHIEPLKEKVVLRIDPPKKVGP